MQYYSDWVVKPDQTKLGSTKPNKKVLFFFHVAARSLWWLHLQSLSTRSSMFSKHQLVVIPPLNTQNCESSSLSLPSRNHISHLIPSSSRPYFFSFSYLDTAPIPIQIHVEPYPPKMCWKTFPGLKLPKKKRWLLFSSKEKSHFPLKNPFTFFIKRIAL